MMLRLLFCCWWVLRLKSIKMYLQDDVLCVLLLVLIQRYLYWWLHQKCYLYWWSWFDSELFALIIASFSDVEFIVELDEFCIMIKFDIFFVLLLKSIILPILVTQVAYTVMYDSFDLANILLYHIVVTSSSVLYKLLYWKFFFQNFPTLMFLKVEFNFYDAASSTTASLISCSYPMCASTECWLLCVRFIIFWYSPRDLTDCQLFNTKIQLKFCTYFNSMMLKAILW